MLVGKTTWNVKISIYLSNDEKKCIYPDVNVVYAWKTGYG